MFSSCGWIKQCVNALEYAPTESQLKRWREMRLWGNVRAGNARLWVERGLCLHLVRMTYQSSNFWRDGGFLVFAISVFKEHGTRKFVFVLFCWCYPRPVTHEHLDFKNIIMVYTL